ncbi:UBA_like_SF and PTH2 domain-containing protein isoform X3 [Scyliorhinus canicula]|uniref:UBA_like_SF and PTH2 domain-containing protein isoform X3 n=1 Tax=Scyliorhinus canicula TaxID=7830 RepID=UPI0018F7CD81|nr:UBA_like_SF and PTH2 domain-containing protein isoform X3 [Scyliorhinus canicula]
MGRRKGYWVTVWGRWKQPAGPPPAPPDTLKGRAGNGVSRRGACAPSTGDYRGGGGLRSETLRVPGSEMAEPGEVNPVFLQQLMELGISEEKAKEALIKTGNQSSDSAALFYFSELEMFSGFEVGVSGTCAYKMVFVVNMELTMGIGKVQNSWPSHPKVAAQVAHAAVGLYQMMLEESDSWQQMLTTWDNDGGKKIVLKGQNSKHILELQEQACLRKLPNYLVEDAGKTQIAAGSRTVLAIMGEEKLVNQVTGNLQLL